MTKNDVIFACTRAFVVVYVGVTCTAWFIGIKDYLNSPKRKISGQLSNAIMLTMLALGFMAIIWFIGLPDKAVAR